ALRYLDLDGPDVLSIEAPQLDDDGRVLRAVRRAHPEAGGLVGHARPVEVELPGLEAGIAHQPAEQALPHRAVPPARRARAELRELDLPGTVDAERDRASVALVADREDRHRRAALRRARRVRPEHEPAGADVAEDVRSGHLR